jgi:TolB-like protein
MRADTVGISKKSGDMSDSNKAVFLSYASQDAVAAAEITRALRAAGIEVWFDQSELRGGDAWDASIRKQIKSCSLFIPVISKNTHAREEGYFRLEWKLAVDRSHLMATSKAFLLPVVIDDTRDKDDRVPDRFREVQWTRLPDGRASPAFVERVAKLLAPEGVSSVMREGAPANALGVGSLGTSSAITPKSRATASRGLLLLGAAAVIAVGYLEIHRVLEARHEATVPMPAKSVDTPPLAAAGAGVIPDKSIAVLPFLDMSEKKDQEYFSDGLAEELLDLLAQVHDLHVAARTSSFSFRGKSDDIAAIAQKLHVAHVLEGSVRRAGNVIRVSAQLIRADNGYNLWSKTYDRQLKDIFKVQDEIAGAVVDALKVQLLPAQQIESRHRTSNTEAYTEYLLGNQFRALDTSESNDKALAAYQQATTLDPNFAAAYSGLAETEWRIADSTTNDPGAYAQAMSSAEKAIALAPDSPEGYWARGQLRNSYYYDWQAAQLDFEKALALDPSFTPARIEYALLLATLGRSSDSIAEVRKVLSLDPLSTVGWRRLGWLLMQDGRFDEARAAARRMHDVNPSADDRYLLGFATLLEGRPAVALQSFAADDTRVAPQGVAMAEYSLGNREASDRALAAFIKQNGTPLAYQYAEVYSWRGEKDKAFEWLDTAYGTRDGGLVYVTYDRAIQNLRGDPRYAALLRKMKLAPG